MSDSAPLVSVVMPLHNGVEAFRQAMKTLLDQDTSDFEIICIDDASDDGAREVLAHYESSTSRIKAVYHALKKGAAASRNEGMDIAIGKYLLFLDADDLFEPTLIGRVTAEACRTNADMVLFGADEFEIEGAYRRNEFFLEDDLIPTACPFNRDDVPQQLFQLCTPEPWTKLFNREFVVRHRLRFQELQNANDMLFTLSGLALAQRISSLNERLVHHRVGRPGSIQWSRGRDPLAFLKALRALGQRLRTEGLYDRLFKSYANLVVFHCLFNDDAAAPWADIFTELGVAALPRDSFWLSGDYERFVKLVLESWDQSNSRADAFPSDFWYNAALLQRDELRCVRADLDEVGRQTAEAWREAGRIKDSLSFRVGSMLTAPCRLLRTVIRPFVDGHPISAEPWQDPANRQ